VGWVGGERNPLPPPYHPLRAREGREGAAAKPAVDFSCAPPSAPLRQATRLVAAPTATVRSWPGGQAAEEALPRASAPAHKDQAAPAASAPACSLCAEAPAWAPAWASSVLRPARRQRPPLPWQGQAVPPPARDIPSPVRAARQTRHLGRPRETPACARLQASSCCRISPTNRANRKPKEP